MQLFKGLKMAISSNVYTLEIRINTNYHCNYNHYNFIKEDYIYIIGLTTSIILIIGILYYSYSLNKIKKVN